MLQWFTSPFSSFLYTYLYILSSFGISTINEKKPANLVTSDQVKRFLVKDICIKFATVKTSSQKYNVYSPIPPFFHTKNDSKIIEDSSNVPLGLCPRLFMTTFSSGKVKTPSSSLSKSMNTSLYSATWVSVSCHSSCV